MAALAPGVVGRSLQHRPGFVGDDADRAQMILVEVARKRRLAEALDFHADHLATGNQVVAPLLRATGAITPLRGPALSNTAIRAARTKPASDQPRGWSYPG